MKAAIIYLFNIIYVAHNCMHIYEIFSFSLSKLKEIVLLFFSLNKRRWEAGTLRQRRNLMYRGRGTPCKRVKS